MISENIIENLRKELLDNRDVEAQKSSQNFFKENVKLYGIKNPFIKRLSKDYFEQIKGYSKEEVFGLCEVLWSSGYIEESIIACNWSFAKRKDFNPGDILIFAKWIEAYVNNWASCDTLCCQSIGALLEMYPECLQQLPDWAKSSNRWMRRAAAVSLVTPARHGRYLEDVFVIADILLLDQDDLVQKGYGWMLKVASKMYQEEVFRYIIEHKAVMPRTALRYAIEKMPPVLRVEAMKK